MKKLLLVLSMAVCFFGMTVNASESVLVTEQEATEYINGLVEQVSGIVAEGMESQYSQGDEILSTLFANWNDVVENIGSYQSISGHKLDIGEERAEITAVLQFEKGEAEFTAVLQVEDMQINVASITIERAIPMSERMGLAGLNTLLGMGMVFAVLIIIIAIISLFKFLPSDKKPETASKPAVDGKVVEQISENEENLSNTDLSDDMELVAVIAAAIAASEGRASTDGFVVRSIRRSSTNKWQRA